MKKSILTTAVLLFAATFALADDTTPTAAPPELLAAQAKYDAAIAAAVKAINEKYVAYLTAMKKKAMADGKLELAVAVDKEIKAAAEAKPKAPLTARELDGWMNLKGKTLTVMPHVFDIVLNLDGSITGSNTWGERKWQQKKEHLLMFYNGKLIQTFVYNKQLDVWKSGDEFLRARKRDD